MLFAELGLPLGPELTESAVATIAGKLKTVVLSPSNKTLPCYLFISDADSDIVPAPNDCSILGPVPKKPLRDLTGPSNVVLAIIPPCV